MSNEPTTTPTPFGPAAADPAAAATAPAPAEAAPGTAATLRAGIDPMSDPASALDSVEATLNSPRTVALALGSNIGNRMELLQGAVDALEDTPGLRVRAVSAVFETDPVGGPEGQRSYLNAVVLARTTLPPRSVLERANAVEDAFSRTREVRWGPRTLDVDILAYEGVVSTDPRLTLPHPRAHERAFVLAPWCDVDPEAEIPGHGRVADLLAAADRAGVHHRPDLELHIPE